MPYQFKISWRFISLGVGAMAPKSFYPKHRMGRNQEDSSAVIQAGSTTPTGTKSKEWVRLARVIERAVDGFELSVVRGNRDHSAL